jgi:hypothetical protein
MFDMLIKGFIKNVETYLRHYIDGGDYSRPVIIAEWPCIGSYHRTWERLDRSLGIEQRIVINYESDATELIAMLEDRDPESRKIVIYELVVSSEDSLQPLLDAGYDVFFIKFDKEDWFSWAGKVGFRTCRRRVARSFTDFLHQSPEEYLHSYYNPENRAMSTSDLAFMSPKKWYMASHYLKLGLKDAIEGLCDTFPSLNEDPNALVVFNMSLKPINLDKSLYINGELDANRLENLLDRLTEEEWAEWMHSHREGLVATEGKSRADIFTEYLERKAMSDINPAIVDAYFNFKTA